MFVEQHILRDIHFIYIFVIVVTAQRLITTIKDFLMRIFLQMLQFLSFFNFLSLLYILSLLYVN